MPSQCSYSTSAPRTGDLYRVVDGGRIFFFGDFPGEYSRVVGYVCCSAICGCSWCSLREGCVCVCVCVCSVVCVVCVCECVCV